MTGTATDAFTAGLLLVGLCSSAAALPTLPSSERCIYNVRRVTGDDEMLLIGGTTKRIEWAEFTSWARLPEVTTRALTHREQLNAIKSATGWSTREIGIALDVSHTTVRHLLEGRFTAKSAAARARIEQIYALVTRLEPVAGDIATLRRAMGDADIEASALTALSRTDYARAYIIALREINGAKPKLLTSRPGATRRRATADLSLS